jgi:hypothetical protein
LLLAGSGCAFRQFPPETTNDVMLLRPDGGMEVTLGGSGYVDGVEFHVPLETLPEEIHEAALNHAADSEIVSCEKEYLGRKQYWEVTVLRGSKQEELLFDSAGTVHRWEIQIDVLDAPEAILEEADSAVGGWIVEVEEIRDADYELVEYHVKKNNNGDRYKLVFRASGKLKQVYKEVPAELEVPIW